MFASLLSQTSHVGAWSLFPPQCVEISVRPKKKELEKGFGKGLELESEREKRKNKLIRRPLIFTSGVVTERSVRRRPKPRPSHQSIVTMGLLARIAFTEMYRGTWVVDFPGTPMTQVAARLLRRWHEFQRREQLFCDLP